MKTQEITVESPTRIDLAGGTLDMWPLHAFLTEAKTINLAIDIKTRCHLRLREDQKVILRSKDVDLDESFSSLEEFFASIDPKLYLLQVLFAFAKPKQGFEIETSSQSPVGGGLGGSSSLTVSILKAMQSLDMIEPFKNVSEFAQVAANLEACILKTPTGTQDYIPAIQGGLNVIDYGFRGIRVETLPAPQSILESLTLVYTGRAHHSGINNFEVLKKAVAQDKVVMSALANLRKTSQKLASMIEASDLSAMDAVLTEELSARVQLAEAFMSPEIKEIQEIANGFDGGQIKICGAGGGGCVLVWSQSKDRAAVAQACENKGFKVLNFKAVEPLSSSW